MAEFVHEDVVEQILIRSDVKDMIRFKSVCKSWHSLITSPRFINLQLNHSYNKDGYNNEFDHKRITLEDDDNYDHHLVGSSNGLGCICSKDSWKLFICSKDSWKLLVGNPLTREARQLKLPHGSVLMSFSGFGYDSSRDDYKVIVGEWDILKGEYRTCVQVLSLKSNVCRVIGEVKYSFITKVGILCNGALHWIVEDQEHKKLIISYDLSTDKFKEVLPLPDNARYALVTYLGIRNGCLCFYRCLYTFVDRWLMKNYHENPSWELLPDDYEIKYDFIYFLTKPRMDGSCLHSGESWFSRCSEYVDRDREYIDYPIFVESLVPPHVYVNPYSLTHDRVSIIE